MVDTQACDTEVILEQLHLRGLKWCMGKGGNGAEFEVMYNKFNIDRICTYALSSSQKYTTTNTSVACTYNCEQ